MALDLVAACPSEDAVVVCRIGVSLSMSMLAWSILFQEA